MGDQLARDRRHSEKISDSLMALLRFAISETPPTGLQSSTWDGIWMAAVSEPVSP
jgi:hypothetical protein